MAPLEIIPNEELDTQMRFETLLAEISTLFISLPVDQIDNKVEDVQRCICEYIDLDRSTLWQVFENNPETLLLSHIYQPFEGQLPADRMNAKDFFPWVLQQMIAGKTVTLSKMTDLPAEAIHDRESFKYYGAKSGVYVPLSVGQGPLMGVLTFAAMREERSWTETIVKGFTLLGRVFSSALARKQSEQAMERRLLFETLLAKISARFVNLPADRLDSELTDAMRCIFELLDLDLVALWQCSNEVPDLFTLTHIYSTQGGPQPSELNQDHFPWCLQQILSGQIVTMSSLDELPVEAALDRESCRLFGIKSNLTIPLSVGDEPPIGILGFNTMRAECDWPEVMVNRLQLIAQIFTNALERKRLDGQLRENLREIENLKLRLEQENVYLQEEVKLLTDHSGILGQSTPMKNILIQAEQVAGTDTTVLLLGETGTGKELLAREIHSMSLRKDRPLVTVNCASLPPTLIENELFGREKGAYTGALTKMIGRFELADGSTLFLDEIGELPLDLQSKLLRVLEEGTFERLGSTKPLHVNVRIIAATNRDIKQEVEDGKFRQDLFYRLNVFPILIAPLRERLEDIPLLVRAFVREFEKKLGKQVDRIPEKTMRVLKSYPWPGNVRELRNVIERAMILSKNKTLVVHLPKNGSPEPAATSSLEDVIRREIMAVLKKTRWRVAGRDGAAEILGLKRSTLYTKMKKLGIRRPDRS